ncbi:hypothetical protein PCYB_002160 [Plasmodium cynomolgi strain B]|uniref:CYIR protein n=1 Tax=Plasmodium cynomolgi (strain B) TaxID=1120755 RepID=K6VJ92_PLACD|nr:hypothetical protein PCYB_002160 [Plasmodium cynomolgi strain B]GAB69467.1 hypothetical protein PCYB_002160 [Plasmodium cynomolgi strain B]
MNLNTKDARSYVKKYAQNLKKLSENLQNVKNDKERCRYLNLWIYSEIGKMFPRNIDNIYELGFMHEFFSEFYEIKRSLNKECRFTYNSNISLDLWKKFKDIHDYFRNIDYIKSKIPDDKNKCPRYPEYIRYIKEIYVEYTKECCGSDTSKCPQEIYFEEWCNKSHMLEDLECTTNELEKIPDQGHTSESPQNSHKNPNQLDSPDNNNLASGNSISNILAPSILSCLGIFTTFFVLYKMTPIGTKINNALGRIGYVNNILKLEDSKELVNYNREYYNPDFQEARYNVSYNVV